MLFKDAVYMQNIKVFNIPSAHGCCNDAREQMNASLCSFPLLYHENVHQNNKWAGLRISCLWLVKKGKTVFILGSMHGGISGEALGMLDNFRRS